MFAEPCTRLVQDIFTVRISYFNGTMPGVSDTTQFRNRMRGLACAVIGSEGGKAATSYNQRGITACRDCPAAFMTHNSGLALINHALEPFEKPWPTDQYQSLHPRSIVCLRANTQLQVALHLCIYLSLPSFGLNVMPQSGLGKGVHSESLRRS